MTVRGITPDDLIRDRRVSAIAFVMGFDEEKERATHPNDEDAFWMGCTLGAFDENDRVCARFSIVPYTVNFDGHWCGMGGIGGVASLPEGRQKGNIRAIFERAFERMLDDNVLWSALYPFSHVYYRKFGYEQCMQYLRYTIPMDQLAGFPEPYGVAMLDDGAERADFDALQTRFAGQYNLATKRGDREWKSAFGGGLKSLRYAYLLRGADGNPEAYIILHASGEDNHRKLEVAHIAYDGHDALRRTLGFIYRLRAQFRDVSILLPAREELLSALPEPWEVKVRLDSCGMARAMDVQGVLERIALPEGAGRFSVEVSGDMIGRNNGVFAVEYDGGGRQVKKTSGDADASMNIQTFSLLALGGSDMYAARIRPDLRVNGNERTLSGVFKRKPIFLLDRF